MGKEGTDVKRETLPQAEIFQTLHSIGPRLSWEMQSMQSISKDVRTVSEATRFRRYHDAFFLTQQFAHVALFRLIKDECSRSRFDMNLGR